MIEPGEKMELVAVVESITSTLYYGVLGGFVTRADLQAIAGILVEMRDREAAAQGESENAN